MKIELKKNAHPNTDGSPWGWIGLDATRIRVATWSGHEEKKYCESIVRAVNTHAQLVEALEKFTLLNPDHYKDIAGLIINAKNVIETTKS
jgi:hypothetical protein